VLFHEAGVQSGVAWSLHNQGYVAQHGGDLERASWCFSKSLALFQALADTHGLGACLAGCAAVSWATRPARAARLFGAAAALAAGSQVQIAVAHRAEQTRNLEATRSRMDEAAWTAAWAEGQAMAQEQAVAYALQKDI
jgi:hypothetical protein